MTEQHELLNSTTEQTVTTVLNRAQEDAIVQFWLSGGKTVTQTWIAQHFNVSRKTIYTVLKERGALLDKKEVINLVRLNQIMQTNKMTMDELEEAICQPAMTPQNVIAQLTDLDEDSLKDIVYELIGRRFMMDRMYKEMTDAA